MTDENITLIDRKAQKLISIPENSNHFYNSVLDNIYSRRSVRNFTEQDIPDEVIEEIVRAGIFAPTAVNKQPWRFVIIKNRQRVAECAERARIGFLRLFREAPGMDGFVKWLSNPKADIFYSAPVLILVFSSPDAVTESDCALAAQNMMLAAWSLGVGSCWIGLARALGSDREFLNEAEVPDDHKLVAPLIFGYPSKSNLKAPVRNPNVILSWYGKADS
ncbi:MAG TPA: nitroreductase [Methanocella sp.]|nr:nitroreductase [Methanocella sp.]